MCIAVPLRVERIDGDIAYCRAGEGTIQTSLLLMDEDVKVGDYLLIHAGFAIKRLDEKEATETIELMREALELT